MIRRLILRSVVRHRPLLAFILSLAVLGNWAQLARACGPSSIDPIFVFKTSPDLPFTEYTRGRIGIVRPSFGRKTLFIAYRYLNGRSFTSDEQQALVEALRGIAPEGDDGAALKAWIAARAEIVAKEDKLPAIYTERQYGGYDFFPNCTENAFEVATATLKDRAAMYGAEDVDVRAWLAAQDSVFQNCQGTGEVPGELGPESPAWLRKDRDYQIGAALLYSLNFEAARARFERIARDDESSWHETAEYLIGRTLVRQASLSTDKAVKHELYNQAENDLQIIAARRGRFSLAAQKLLALIKYRQHPVERVRELAGTLATQSGDDNLKQDLIDYAWLLDKFEDRILKEEEEKKKAAAAEGKTEEPREPFENQQARERFEAIQKGDQIMINFYPLQADGKPDYGNYVGLWFKFDVTLAEVLPAVEAKVGRKLTPPENQQLNERYAAAMDSRRYQISPNRQFDREGMNDHEGCDYECRRLTLDLVPDFLRADDLSDWIFALQTEDPKAYDYARVKFHDTDSPAWLIAALIKAESTSPQVERLMREAAKIDRGSPAFATAAHHLIRLRIALGRKAEARKMLDEIILPDAESLPVSARNQFREQRLRVSENLGEFLKFAQRQPVAFYEEGVLGTMRDLLAVAQENWRPDYQESKEEYEQHADDTYRELLLWDDRVVFDEATLDILNWHFPLTALDQAARDPAVPEYLRRRLIFAVWTRAVLLGNQEAARRIAPEVIKVAPEMQPIFMSYLNATTAEERQHAALFVLLKFPSLSPLVAGGIPEFATAEKADYYFESSWWCQPSDTEYNNAGEEVPKIVPRPAFLTVEQLAAQRERAALVAIGNGKSYLGKQVLRWAKLSPDDPRIPEALFIAFKANDNYKYGCGGWEYNEELQQEIGALIRERYPASPWTAKLSQ